LLQVQSYADSADLSLLQVSSAASAQARAAMQEQAKNEAIAELKAALKTASKPAVAQAALHSALMQVRAVVKDEPAAAEAGPAAPATAAVPTTTATPAAAAAPVAEKIAEPTQFARIAPFGKEDTAAELQHHAAMTQDTLVDAVENAEVAEVKRSVFRALTRLRAASIKEFDTIARLETQSIDEYNDAHHYRTENPIQYLHGDEPAVKEDKFTAFH